MKDLRKRGERGQKLAKSCGRHYGWPLTLFIELSSESGRLQEQLDTTIS